MDIDIDFIRSWFHLPGFYDMWYSIQERYENMGFQDDIPDDVRIKEYKWITQQLRKYISRQENIVLGHDSIDDMIEEVKELIGKAPEYGSSRQEIVYNIMRDSWLIEIYRGLQILQSEEE